MKTVILFMGSGDFTGGCKMGFWLAQSFRDQGYRVVAIVGERPEAPVASVIDSLLEDGFEVICERGFPKLLDVKLLKRCIRHIRDARASLVVSLIQIDVKISGWAARLAGVPWVVFAQSQSKFYGSPLLRKLKNVAYAATIRLNARRVICTSEAVAQQAAQEFGISPKRLTVLPSGIETSVYAEVGIYGKDLLPAASLRFLNVGRLDSQKGQKVLVRAFAAALKDDPAARLFLVGGTTIGSGPSEAYDRELRQLIAELGLTERVVFLGWRDDIPALHAASDIYVHAALWEGPPLPLAVLEAMASAKPVIFTDCSGIPEGFVDGEQGFIVKAGDDRALALAIKRVRELSPANCAEMGSRARKLCLDLYDIKAIGRRFVESSVKAIDFKRGAG